MEHMRLHMKMLLKVENDYLCKMDMKERISENYVKKRELPLVRFIDILQARKNSLDIWCNLQLMVFIKCMMHQKNFVLILLRQNVLKNFGKSAMIHYRIW